MLLLAIVILFLFYFLLPFMYSDIKYALPSQKKHAIEKGHEESEYSLPSPADYMIISEENLFHPERRIPPEKKAEQELPKPEFVLYGTMIMDNFGIAYLEDLKAPRTTPGRGKRQVALKKGDSLSGFTLTDIQADKIVVTRGEEKMIVQIIDPRNPKQREAPVPVSQQAPAQQVKSPQKGTPATSVRPKSPVAAKILPTPKEQPAQPPPRSSFESTVRGFFDRGKQ